jgi:hypothetical protein
MSNVQMNAKDFIININVTTNAYQSKSIAVMHNNPANIKKV